MRKIMIALAMVLMFGCAMTTQTRDQIINTTQQEIFEKWFYNEMSQYQSVVQTQTQSNARVTVINYRVYDSYSAGLAKVKVELPNREVIGYFVVLRPVASWYIHSFVLVSEQNVDNDVKRQLEARNEVDKQPEESEGDGQ